MAAPTIWNQLPSAIKSSETIDTFRKKLETHLFEIAFHHRILAVPFSNDDFCLLFLVSFVCCASELEYFKGFRHYITFTIIIIIIVFLHTYDLMIRGHLFPY